MELNFESLGSAAGSALPIPFGSQLGSFAGNILGKLTGGGATKAAPGAFAGKHSMYTENLDDSQVNQPDADVYLRQAARCGVSVEEVAILMAVDADANGATAQQVWDGYAAGTSNGLSGRAVDFNRQGMGRIMSGALGPVGAPANARFRAVANYGGKAKFITLAAVDSGASASSSTPVPTSQRFDASSFIADQSAPVPTSQQPVLTSNLTGTDLKGIGKAAWDGAVKGASDAAMKTPEGKIAQNAGAKQWLNDNGLIIGLVISVIVGAFTYLLTRKK